MIISKIVKNHAWVLKDFLKTTFDSLAFLNKYNKKDNQILLLRIDAIGDFVLWLNSAIDIINYYKQQNKKVSLLANSAWASWAKELGIFDEVISLNIKQYGNNLIYRYKFLKKIRLNGYETVVHSTYSRTLNGDSLVRMSGALTRVGYSGDCANINAQTKKKSDKWYTKLIVAENSKEAEIVRNNNFSSILTGLTKKLRIVDLKSLLQNPNSIDHFMKLTDGKRFYILFPGASWSGRQWPIDNFVKIADKIYQRTGMIGVVCGSNTEKNLASSLVEKTTAPIVDLCGKTSLNQLALVISRAYLLLSNETSAVHIAAAVGTKAFCILGGGHFGRFSPYPESIEYNNFLPTALSKKLDCYYCNWNCIYTILPGKCVPCIEQVEVEYVWSEIDTFIQNFFY